MSSYVLIDLDPCLKSSSTDSGDLRDARDHVVLLINQRVLPKSRGTKHVLVGISKQKDATQASSFMSGIVAYVNTMEGKKVMKGYVLLDKKRKGKLMMADGTTPYPDSKATMHYLTCRPGVIGIVEHNKSWWNQPFSRQLRALNPVG